MDTLTRNAQVASGYLFVIPWDVHELGGVSQAVLNLYRELGTLGWASSVLVSDWSALTPVLDSTGTAPVFRWRVRSPWSRHRAISSMVAFLASLPRTAWTWRNLARRHDWRIVNVHYPSASALTWIALKRSRLWKGKVVISVHGREVRDALHEGDRIERRLMRLVMEEADAIVACSNDLANDVLELAPSARNHLLTIPNGATKEALLSEFDRAFVLPAGLASRRFILNVATFEHKKAQDVLIEAFVPIAAKRTEVDLVLVGRSTPWVEEIRRQVAASGVGSRVHIFTDVPHRHVLTFLSRATVFCLPSRSEGHPLAILEAATFGLPVVATPVGGIPQTIPDDTYGLLVPAANAPALTEALGRIIDDERLARSLGQSLQRLVESQFSWTTAARRYSELAHRLLG